MHEDLGVDLKKPLDPEDAMALDLCKLNIQDNVSPKFEVFGNFKKFEDNVSSKFDMFDNFEDKVSQKFDKFEDKESPKFVSMEEETGPNLVTEVGHLVNLSH